MGAHVKKYLYEIINVVWVNEVVGAECDYLTDVLNFANRS